MIDDHDTALSDLLFSCCPRRLSALLGFDALVVIMKILKLRLPNIFLPPGPLLTSLAYNSSIPRRPEFSALAGLYSDASSPRKPVPSSRSISGPCDGHGL